VALVAALGLALLVGPRRGRRTPWWRRRTRRTAPRLASSPVAGGRNPSPKQAPTLARSLIQVLETSGHKARWGCPGSRWAGQPSTVVRIPVPATLPKGVLHGVLEVDLRPSTATSRTGGLRLRCRPGTAARRCQDNGQGRPGPSEVAVRRPVVLPVRAHRAAGACVHRAGRAAGPWRPRSALHPAMAPLLAGGGGGACSGSRRPRHPGAGPRPRQTCSSELDRELPSLLRGIPLLVAGMALLGLRRLGRAGGRTPRGEAAPRGDGSATFSKSHAAAGSSWAWLHITEQWLHIVAAGIWAGGLAGPPPQACVPWGRANRGACGRRFLLLGGRRHRSGSASTGTLRAFDEVGELAPALPHRLRPASIVVKIALFRGCWALLGAVNRFRKRRGRGKGAQRHSARTGGAELVAMGPRGWLQNRRPCRNLAPARHRRGGRGGRHSPPRPFVDKPTTFFGHDVPAAPQP